MTDVDWPAFFRRREEALQIHLAIRQRVAAFAVTALAAFSFSRLYKLLPFESTWDSYPRNVGAGGSIPSR